MSERHETLKVTSKAVQISIKGEPFVTFTARGYAPVVNVEIEGGELRTLFLSPMTLSRALQEMVDENGGKFDGIVLTIGKESDDKFSKYVLTRN